MDITNFNPAKIMKISDSLNETMRDEADLCRSKYPSIGGLLLVKNKRGDVLLRKNNLVVFRGRLFALERLFYQPYNTPYNYIPNTGRGNERGSDPASIENYVGNIANPDVSTTNGDLSYLLNRKVCLFGIGEGGVENSAWFTPTAVTPTAVGLSKPLAFCEATTTDVDYNGDDGRNRAFYVKNASDNYCYYKRLNTKNADDHFYPQWVYDVTTNTIAMMTTLHIDESYLTHPKDGIVKRINELALFMATESNDGEGNAVFSNIEMFSKITFDTESLYANKELVIEYYIFA